MTWEGVMDKRSNPKKERAPRSSEATEAVGVRCPSRS